jgi:uncharacterized damage-inducible protein DinB
MRISETLTPQFDHEMGLTRRLLERVPAAHAAFKPHPKSSALGDLAMHIATIPHWAVATLTLPDLDFAAASAAPYHVPAFTGTPALLAHLAAGVAGSRAALVVASDADLLTPWTLRVGARTVLAMPRIAVLRGFILSHMIHHRGQLDVYLRMVGVPLPALYGPSADETGAPV